MAHLIEETDRVFSTVGTEWHGLAEMVEIIDRETISTEILWPLLTGQHIVCEIDGANVDLPDNQVIIADWRNRTDLPEGMRRLEALHVPKNRYFAVDNGTIFDAMQEAATACNGVIATAGTLRGGKEFFVSIGLTEGDTIDICGDTHLRYANIVTSHDGTKEIFPHLSMVRIVCANTVRASLESAEQLITIRHTQAAEGQIVNMPRMFENMIKASEIYKGRMEALAEVKASEGFQRELIAGYLALENNVKPGQPLATRSMNAVNEIARLASDGRGNAAHRTTLYGLANGATEYWSEGDGTGRGGASFKKAYSSNMGTGMEHKEKFIESLADTKLRHAIHKAGKAVLALAQ